MADTVMWPREAGATRLTSHAVGVTLTDGPSGRVMSAAAGRSLWGACQGIEEVALSATPRKPLRG